MSAVLIVYPQANLCYFLKLWQPPIEALELRLTVQEKREFLSSLERDHSYNFF